MGGIRVVDTFLAANSRRRPQDVRHCDAPGCFAPTRENKQFCTKHVDHHPYVQRLIDAWAQKAKDDATVAQKGPRAANVEMLSAQEMLSHLETYGSRTTNRLVRELNLPVKTIENFAEMLKRKGLIKYDYTKRGDTVLKLCNPDEAKAPPKKRPPRKRKPKAKTVLVVAQEEQSPVVLLSG